MHIDTTRPENRPPTRHAGATCSQLDRAKAWAAQHDYYENPSTGIIEDEYGSFVAHGWSGFYVKFLYDIERDGCA